MPSKRRRVSHEATAQISPAILSVLSEGLYPMPADCEEEIIEWEFVTPDEDKARLLEQVKGGILAEWIRQRPGTRPAWWWLSEAPEKSRRRLGGLGDASHDHLNYVESYDHGIPTQFLDASSVEYYNGRARDIHGKKIGDHNEGDFSGQAIDPDDPPRYESQATFLKRHGLLTAAEKRRLRKVDFKPEIVCFDEES